MKPTSKSVPLFLVAFIFVTTCFADSKTGQRDLRKQLKQSISEQSLGARLQPQWGGVPLGGIGDRVPPEWLDGPTQPIGPLGQTSIPEAIQRERDMDGDLFRRYLKYNSQFNCNKEEAIDLVTKGKSQSKTIKLKLSALGHITVNVESSISAKKTKITNYQLFNTKQYNNFIDDNLRKYGGLFPNDEKLTEYLQTYSANPYQKGKGVSSFPALKQRKGTTLRKIEESAQLEYASSYSCADRYNKKIEKIKYQVTHNLKTNDVKKLLNQKLAYTITDPPAKQCVGENTIAQFRDLELGIANAFMKSKPYPVINRYFSADMKLKSLTANASVNYYQCNKNSRNQCEACLVGSCCMKITRYYGERKLVKSKTMDISLKMINVDGAIAVSLDLGGEEQIHKLQEKSSERALQLYIHPSFKNVKDKVTISDVIESTQVFEMTDSVTPSVALLIEFAIEEF